MKRALVVVLALLAPAVARAAEPEPALATAKRAYGALEYEACLEAALRAEPTAQTLQERVDVALYDGLCSYELGRRDRAERRFEDALRLDPRATLPAFTSPKIVAAFSRLVERSRATTAPAPVAPRSPEPPPSRSGPPLLTYVLGGVAVASAGAGAFLAVRAHDVAGDADRARFESDAYALGERARTTMTGANLAFGLAAATAVAAAVLWVFAPSAPPAVIRQP